MSATYLYCLVRRPEAPELAGAPQGVPGALPPRLLDVGDQLWLVAAQVPLPEYGEAEIASRLEDLSWVSERALAHEEMVEHFARAAPAGAPAETGHWALLPMKLFTLFASDERAVQHVAGELPRLRRVLDRVAGREEWGVRVRRSPERAAAAAGEAPAGRPASGREFLAQKHRQLEAARRAPAEAREVAENAYARLVERAAEALRREPEAGTSLVLDAAFLVPRSDRGPFADAVAAVARELAGAACELTLTGPWPPYNFAGEEER
ncbi:MAG TPA: GvpL/GvpF family gas vesicle protein [Thermoanaerobaculia bacterium]|nr:GvpL/GvpF family gas vesicle protein [Thermoanaerobaculia bacterium]